MLVRKCMVVTFVMTVFLLFVQRNDVVADGCPSPGQLVATPFHEYEQLSEQLTPHLPANWHVHSLTPLPLTVGKREEAVYLQLARELCSDRVAEKSWLLRLRSTKVGRMEKRWFVAKNNEGTWFVWQQFDELIR